MARQPLGRNPLGDLANLAWRLALPECERFEQDGQIAAVIDWLRERHGWLIVLDNFEPVAKTAVERHLSPGLRGHVIATARTPMWSTQLRLGPLPSETAVAYLLQRTGQNDVRAAGVVAEELGGLPLALAQAAAYLTLSGRDIASYAELLRNRLLDLMAEGAPDDHPATVATTWQMSFERLEREHPSAVALLRLCSFLSPRDIPLNVLRDNAETMPSGLCDALADDIQLDRTIGALRSCSLVERAGDALSVHRLVQVAVRATMGADCRRVWLRAAIALLAAAFPDEPFRHPQRWPLSARLLPHVQFIEQLEEDLTIEAYERSGTLQRAGGYAWARGELDLARSLLERAATMREQVLGRDHVETADCLVDIGVLLRDHFEGQTAAARRLLERALSTFERALGPDDPVYTAACLTHLADLLLIQGQPEAARPLAERAVAIRERQLGADDPRTAYSLNGLARLRTVLGDFASATVLAERAVAIHEEVLGPDHPWTAGSLIVLTDVLHKRDMANAARPLAERALAIQERVLAPDHPRTARSLHTLARLHRDQGDPAAARPLFERALAIRERVLGQNHPDTVATRRALAELAAEGDGAGTGG